MAGFVQNLSGENAKGVTKNEVGTAFEPNCRIESGRAMKEAKSRWDHVAKPLNSLGLLEDAVVQIAGIQGTSQISVEKKALIIMCADHGVVEEGVTQTGQEVTAIVTENFASGNSCVCIIANGLM